MAKTEAKTELTFDYDFLEKLVVGIGEVSQITGIPTRQIRYWEDKGIITSLTEEEGKNRRYDYKSIKKILLIKELLDDGYTLEASTEKVTKRMEIIEKMLSKFKQGSR
ncbi:MerR family transcriptional regulator [Olivibacter ginsenosidimutans]|uniref:MerR family transcriptional regulator n=1 Tax=Olivibacter ginsenosidimutans TaxID=1176537 RepID=A0ABP9B3S8_9SPHI